MFVNSINIQIVISRCFLTFEHLFLDNPLLHNHFFTNILSRHNPQENIIFTRKKQNSLIGSYFTNGVPLSAEFFKFIIFSFHSILFVSQVPDLYLILLIKQYSQWRCLISTVHTDLSYSNWIRWNPCLNDCSVNCLLHRQHFDGNSNNWMFHHSPFSMNKIVMRTNLQYVIGNIFHQLLMCSPSDKIQYKLLKMKQCKDFWCPVWIVFESNNEMKIR